MKRKPIHRPRPNDVDNAMEKSGKERGEGGGERESFHVLALLIGLHPNFKQVWNSDPGRGAHYDADRRIKWREGSVVNFCHS